MNGTGFEPVSKSLKAPRLKEGTATQARGRERASHILATARGILLRDGYQGMTIRNVARAAGISPGNLTYYFRTKEDLFCSIVESVLERYIARVTELQDAHAGDPDERFRAFIRFLVDDARQDEAQQFHYQLWALSRQEAFIDGLRNRFYKSFWDLMRETIAATNPTLDEASLDRRTCELCALSEGLYVMFGNHERFGDLSSGFLDRYPDEALELAKQG